MDPCCTRVDQIPHYKVLYIFDLLVLKSFRMICSQSRVDMSINILNTVTTPGPSKVPEYSHHHRASYTAVLHERGGAKSQLPES